MNTNWGVAMKITKRHKNENGVVYGYTLIDDNGNEAFLKSEAVISMFGSIENAILRKNGEFRAKAGESIETIQDSKSLAIRKKVKLPKVQSSGNMDEPYYGKDYIGICRRIRRYTIEGKIYI